MTYSVHLYDRAGEFTYETVATFTEALAAVRKLTQQYPNKVLAAFNDEQVDADFDGLTEEERDAIDAAVVAIENDIAENEQVDRDRSEYEATHGPEDV